MPFEEKPTEKHRSLWPYLIAGAVIVVAVVVGLGLFSTHKAKHSPATTSLPFGPAEKAYVSNVRFEQPKMSRYANMLHQEVTYVTGEIYNNGNRTIANMQVTMQFHDVQNHVVYSKSVRPLGANPKPLGPGQMRSFDLGFDQIPDTWNEVYPTIQVTGLLLK